MDNEDDDEYDFADEDDIDSLVFDDDKYDGDELSDFVDAVKDADDEVYIELTLDSHDDITEAVAYTCTTAEGNIDSIKTSDRSIEIDNDDYDYTSSTTFSIIDGDDKITKDDDIDDAIDDDKSFEVTAIINDDDEVISVIGYVSAIDDATIDKFEYDDDNDADECYIRFDLKASSVKYYFDDSWKIEEVEEVYDKYDDGDSASIELNDEGKIKKITI